MTTHYNNTNMANYYVNAQDEILAFIKSFKQQSDDLFAGAEQNPFTVTDYGPKPISDFYANVFEQNQQTELQSPLSPRQQELLHLLAHGLSCQQIANQLNLKIKTVYHYLEIIKKKLGLLNRDALVKFYWDKL